MDTHDTQPALPLRPHTIFGVCEAIGEDFGFNPVLLRVPCAAIVLVSPLMAIGAYLGLGLVVLASRLLFPNSTAPRVATDAAAAGEPAANDKNELSLAA